MEGRPSAVPKVLYLKRRDIRKITIAVTQSRATPPMVPPTMAPVGLELEAFVDADEVMGGVVEVVEEIEVELEALGEVRGVVEVVEEIEVELEALGEVRG